MDIATIRRLLQDIYKYRNQGFRGLGIVIYKDINTLPFISFRKGNSKINLPIRNYESIVESLVVVSRDSNPYHDGFHLISMEMELTHLSVYLSTPIILDAEIKHSYGSRYRTALYGSYLPSVYATAIIGDSYGPIIFKDGIEM